MMAAPTVTIKLSNGTTVKVACHACGQPATQNVILKLCRDCSSQCKSQRKHELEDDEDDVQNSEESEMMDTAPDEFDKHNQCNEFESFAALEHSDEPQDVQLKHLDRKVNDCGFDGHGTTLVECCVLGDGRKLVSTGFMEETPLDTVEMLPSLVNYPLNYCLDSQEAEALIGTWLTKSLHQIQVLFMKQAVFFGPHFAVFQLQIIACRLVQILEYGIKDDRWRADRILNERVRGYRMAAKQYEPKCKELRQKIKSWNVGKANDCPEFDGIKDSIARIEGLSAQILNAKRPVPEPKVSALFGDLSIAAPNASTENPQNSTSVKAQKTQPSSIFAHPQKRAPNRAQESGRQDEIKNTATMSGSAPRGLCLPFKTAPSQAEPPQSPMEGVVLNDPEERNPTPQQTFYASAEPKKTTFCSSLRAASADADDGHPQRRKGNNGAEEYVARQKAGDAGGGEVQKDANSHASRGNDPAPDDRYPLPVLMQEQIEEVKMELDIDIDFAGGTGGLNRHDALRIKLYRREKQLDATSKIYVKKREVISALIEELREKLESQG